LARARNIFIDIYFTVYSIVSWLALADIRVDPVIAGATILARARNTFIDIYFTVCSIVS
jgi:hypothetical protein